MAEDNLQAYELSGLMQNMYKAVTFIRKSKYNNRTVFKSVGYMSKTNFSISVELQGLLWLF